MNPYDPPETQSPAPPKKKRRRRRISSLDKSILLWSLLPIVLYWGVQILGVLING